MARVLTTLPQSANWTIKSTARAICPRHVLRHGKGALFKQILLCTAVISNMAPQGQNMSNLLIDGTGKKRCDFDLLWSALQLQSGGCDRVSS